MSLRTAIVVDDDPVITALLTYLLGTYGIEVQTAEDAPGGLALFEARSIDALFTDLRLRDMSGLSLAAEARRRWPNLIIVLMTAARKDEFAEAVRGGIIDFVLAKPFSASEVEAFLDQFGQKK